MTITPALFECFYPCKAIFDVLDPLLGETKDGNSQKKYSAKLDQWQADWEAVDNFLLTKRTQE
jgi:hypothetical protein